MRKVTSTEIVNYLVVTVKLMLKAGQQHLPDAATPSFPGNHGKKKDLNQTNSPLHMAQTRLEK